VFVYGSQSGELAPELLLVKAGFKPKEEFGESEVAETNGEVFSIGVFGVVLGRVLVVVAEGGERRMRRGQHPQFNL
jgi:hypothetical protein